MYSVQSNARIEDSSPDIFLSGGDKFQLCNIMKSIKQKTTVKHFRFIKLTVATLNSKSMGQIQQSSFMLYVKLIQAKQGKFILLE